MSTRGVSSKLATAIVLALITLSSLPLSVRAQTSLDPIVVLYDASHLPQFSPDDEETGLKLMLDMVNASTRYIVRVQQDSPLNASVLNDVDILIIADPDRSAEFDPEELEAISAFLNNGSDLLVMGDPAIDQNSTYWAEQPFQDLGDNIAVNRLLDGLNMSAVRFSINATEDRYWADSMFDYEHALNETSPQVIRFDSTTWDTSHPIFNDINELVVMTATLKPLDASCVVARGYDTSFAQYRKGPFSFANISFPNMSLTEFEEQPLSYSAINGTFPPWLAAFEYGPSRVVITGSTIMFSGRTLDLPESDERSSLRWFYTADNARLFMNILHWLSEDSVEPPSAVYPMLLISSFILVVGVAYYIVKRHG